jgi:hypothetical protein
MKAIIKHKNAARGVVDKGQENIKAVIFDIKGQSVFVKQDFKVLDDRILDAKGRITISNEWMPFKNQTVRSFKIYSNGDGDLLLRPEVTIPAREAWVYQNPDAIKSIKKGIKELEEGNGDIVDDLDSYLEKL